MTKYIAPAALHQLGLPVFSLNAGVEAQDCHALAQQINAAIERAPAVLYLPRLDCWKQSAKIYSPYPHLENCIRHVSPDCNIVLLVTDYTRGAKSTGNDLGFDGTIDEMSFENDVPTEDSVTKFWSKYLNMRFRQLMNVAWEKQSALNAKKQKFEVIPLGPVTMESNSSRLRAIDWDRTSKTEIENMEKEEDVFFGKFREHVKLVIDRVSQHQNGKHFDKAPARDNKEYKEYFKIAVEPLCLSDMRDKNAAKKYENEKEVEADFKQIKDNWANFYALGKKSQVEKQREKTPNYEKLFEDLALLTLMDDLESADIISEWSSMREQRDSRLAWRKRKETKPATLPPTIRQSSRLAGMQARGEEEYGPDEFDKSLLIKLNQTAKKLKDEVDLPKDFSTIALSERMREIERNTSEPLDGMEQLLEELFKLGQEHFVLSKLNKGPIYKMLQEVCKEFCAATDREEE